MKKGLLLVIGLVFSPVVLFSQGKPVIVVHAFSTASGVSWPYDVKQLQAQTVAELKVMLESKGIASSSEVIVYGGRDAAELFRSRIAFCTRSGSSPISPCAIGW